MIAHWTWEIAKFAFWVLLFGIVWADGFIAGKKRGRADLRGEGKIKYRSFIPAKRR